MIMNNELKVSIFANLQSVKSKEVSLDEVIRMTRHDEIIRQKTEGYRQMAQVISREEANRRVKVERMEAFSVGVVFNGSGKQPEHVVRFTGLAMFDIDHVSTLNIKHGTLNMANADERMKYVRNLIINDPHTMVCYKTISNDGYRGIYRYNRLSDTVDGIQPSTVNGTSWKAAFLCGNEYYKKLTGCDYDPACSDYGRLSGMAHDEDVYYNPDAEPFVITDDMILAANFAESCESGKPRKVFDAGTQQATIEEAWSKVSKILARRNMEYQPHHRHDYILHACYLFNRFGVPEDDLRTWAEGQWSDFDSREREAIITHCYNKGQDEHGTWRVSRDSRKKPQENSMITIAEIRQWLTDHVELIYNVVTDQTMVRNIEHYHADNAAAPSALPLRKGEYGKAGRGYDTGQCSMVNVQWSVVDDRILASLRSQMAVDTGKRVLKSDVYDVIKSDFAPLVHPVRDYINALPPWDGKDRVSELISHIRAEASVPGQTDEEAQEDLRWAFHKWHCATVGCWLDDHVTNHQVFTVIGKQGIYKTTFFRFLLPPELRAYFWENAHNTFTTKDDRLALAENCLVDIEEVEATGQKELSELKSLITTDTIKERRPYARFREAKRRLASLCATGNQQRFLTDETGNRRWLCFKVSHIDDPRTWNIDYQQLYAQLRDEFRSGFRYWFNTEDEQRVERLNQPFRVESDEEQLISMRLRKPQEGETARLMNAAMVCQLLNGGHVGYPLSSRKVSVAMVRLGFEVTHTRKGNFFKVIEIPFDQVQSHLSAEAYDYAHEDTHGSSEPEQPAEPKLPF